MSRLVAWWRVLVVVLLAATFAVATVSSAAPAFAADPLPSAEATSPGSFEVYYFWQVGCPHCAEAGPVLDELDAAYPDLHLRKIEISESKANQRQMKQMGKRYGVPVSGTPLIFIGDNSWVGWRAGHQLEIEEVVETCSTKGCPDPSTVKHSNAIDLPGLGSVDLGNRSLLVSTVLIAFVDGFNPCSMWVLTVLIALSLRTGSRRRMILVGSVFVSVTALIYAGFILGLITVVTFLGFSWWIKAIVAGVAGILGLVSIKDYFWFKKGISFSISEDKKPGLIAKMRGVLRHGGVLPLIGATAVLAGGVSLVEFGCTAGFPVLWSNLIQIHEATPGTTLALLALYMLIYQIDEMALFLFAVFTMRAIKLQEKQGRALKLYGGMLMLALAAVMVIDEQLMATLTGSVLVFGGAIAVATAILLVDRGVRGRRTPARSA